MPPLSGTIKTYIKWIGALLLLSFLIIIYKRYSPIDSSWFPKCPFRSLTGLQCPGCGSQRAIHDLLNLDILGAFRENALMVVSIPYIVTAFIFESIHHPTSKLLKWRKALFGVKAIYLIFVLVIGFWILRNLL